MVEIVLLEEISLGFTFVEEAHYLEGLVWSCKVIGLALEVLKFVILRIYQKGRDLWAFLLGGEVLALACSQHPAFLCIIDFHAFGNCLMKRTTE